MNKILGTLKGQKTTILVFLTTAALAGVIYFIVPANRQPYVTPTPSVLDDLNASDPDDIDKSKFLDAIKGAESQKPRAIPDNPTEKDIYANPYILHIRTALNAYLVGSSTGVEAGAVTTREVEGKKCGLKSFDTAYFRSKYFVWDAENNEYGGVIANIVFVDKPDTIFYAWVYQSASTGYTLRGFCESGPPAAEKAEFLKLVKQLLASGEISTTL